MKIVNAATMMELDRRTIHELGLPSLLLMERAALGITDCLVKSFSEQLENIHILVGTGNNGGDGLAIARLLHCQGYKVCVWLQGSKQKRSPDNCFQMELNQKLGIEMKPVVLAGFSDDLASASLIVDALFGVGLCREVIGEWAEVICIANQAEALILAVDIPSGIHADTGQVLSAAIHADLTVTCALPKWGHLLDPGLDGVGDLEIVDIGIPPDYYANHSEFILTQELIKTWKPPSRVKNAHKGNFGRLGIVAGSMGMSGAARLAASAALETGVGLVFLYVPASIQGQLASALPAVQVIPLEEEQGKLSSKNHSLLLQELRKMDAVLLGPGLGREPDMIQLIHYLLDFLEQPLVLDADALYGLPEYILEQSLKQKVILSPHPGEMAHMLHKTNTEVQANRVIAVRQAVKLYQATTILKGAGSLIADPSGSLCFNSGGNPGMARGGMGDILAGLCAGLLTQGLDTFIAASLAVYWHSLAGDLVAQKEGENSLTVMRLLQALPQAWRHF